MDATPIDHPAVELGSILVSLLDPIRGREVDFHRWYERDHFYAGCMIGAGFFAGRRWVATRALKDLRFPATSPVVDDVAAGSYLALYWMLAGRHAETVEWAVNQVSWLGRNERMDPVREQVHAGFYHQRWGVFRDPDGVPKELALDHPYRGSVMLMVDRADGVEQSDFDRWLRREHLPGVLRDSPAAMCLGLEPEPLPDDAPAYVRRPPGLERRSLHLYFLESDPRECWDQVFAPQQRAIASSGLGEVSFTAAFIPTVPGSDRYTDELW
jgi:hypothetical protein